MLKIPLEDIKSKIKKKKIIVKYGKVYNLYVCGHIIENAKDSQKVKFFKDYGKFRRACPICIQSLFLSKYRKCSCGSEQIGNAVYETSTCTQCSAKNIGQSPSKSLRNGHKRDALRWNCIYWETCREEYLMHDAVPCKNCMDFKIGQGENDPLDVKER